MPLEQVKKTVAALTRETVRRPAGRRPDGMRRYKEVPARVDAIDTLVRADLEREFTTRSDDGLLEHLVSESDRRQGERWQGIGLLSRAVLDRQLFKRAARADSPEDLAEAAQTYTKFGSADERRRMEQDAARFAGINPGWKVVVWLPEPAMRLKVAGVLVDSGKGVAALDSLGGPSTQIVQAHKALWATTVYVEPALARDEPVRVAAALGYLREELDLALHDAAGQPVLGPRQLALDLVGRAEALTASDAGKLAEAVKLGAAGAGMTTFGDLYTATREQAKVHGLANDGRPVAPWWTVQD